eukprot:NODE_253_length_11722_cov_0.375118.p7 type:complete len:222 gc:universal NODE_253_length_11722_cov_0.375118:7208-7873(+)
MIELSKMIYWMILFAIPVLSTEQNRLINIVNVFTDYQIAKVQYEYLQSLSGGNEVLKNKEVLLAKVNKLVNYRNAAIEQINHGKLKVFQLHPNLQNFDPNLSKWSILQLHKEMNQFWNGLSDEKREIYKKSGFQSHGWTGWNNGNTKGGETGTVQIKLQEALSEAKSNVAANIPSSKVLSPIGTADQYVAEGPNINLDSIAGVTSGIEGTDPKGEVRKPGF